MVNSPYAVRTPLTVEQRNAIGEVSDVVAHLLYHRGVTEREEALRFLAPSYDEHVLDPFLLKDAEKSVERILRAMESGEHITLYADYDADGIPGAVMWNDFFTRIGYSNYSIYIPHRHNEGFGLNQEAVEQLAREGTKLIVTLDCGIADVMPVRRAGELGMDVIITDHHEPHEELPPAYAIVDHKQKDCPYPDKNLCGSGVGFKVIQGIVKKGVGRKEREEGFSTSLGQSQKGWRFPKTWKDGHEKWLLDMVGIATLSDMVPLVGENRVLAYYGLHVLRKSPRKGLMRLLSKLKISQPHLTEDDIAFMITPRINAASRMGAPMDAFKLLSAESDVDADVYATHLDEINDERKGIVASLVKEIRKLIQERYVEDMPPAIVMGNPEWRPSLLGLVANTCAEEFKRPVFLWGRDGDDVIKGSCRSEGRSNVVEIMNGVPAGVFSHYGGHKQSGGFAVYDEHIHLLEKYLNDAAREISSRQANEPATQDVRYADMELSLDDVTWRLHEDIEKLAPFGIGNPKPVFVFRGVRPASVRKFGKAKDHVELSFMRARSPLSAISFFSAGEEWVQKLEEAPGRAVDLLASVEKSMFRGRKELRLRIEDVIL